jgi:hypothetical protein
MSAAPIGSTPNPHDDDAYDYQNQCRQIAKGSAEAGARAHTPASYHGPTVLSPDAKHSTENCAKVDGDPTNHQQAANNEPYRTIQMHRQACHATEGTRPQTRSVRAVHHLIDHLDKVIDIERLSQTSVSVHLTTDNRRPSRCRHRNDGDISRLFI